MRAQYGIPHCLHMEYSIYTTIFHKSNYNFYLVRGDMFRLLVQPSSGQLKVEQET